MTFWPFGTILSQFWAKLGLYGPWLKDESWFTGLSGVSCHEVALILSCSGKFWTERLIYLSYKSRLKVGTFLFYQKPVFLT